MALPDSSFSSEACNTRFLNVRISLSSGIAGAGVIGIAGAGAGVVGVGAAVNICGFFSSEFFKGFLVFETIFPCTTGNTDFGGFGPAAVEGSVEGAVEGGLVLDPFTTNLATNCFSLTRAQAEQSE